MTDPASILLFYVCLFFEVNTEPFESQMAAAHAILNRAGGDQSKIVKIVFTPKHFSWTSDPVKLREAKKIMRTGILPARMNAMRRRAFAWLGDKQRGPWTHWQGVYQLSGKEKPTWTCYRGGITTYIPHGSAHVYCGDKDVVIPGETPRYIIKREKRRIWRSLRDEKFERDC